MQPCQALSRSTASSPATSGPTLERLDHPVVTRDVLESVIAAADGETLHFIDTTAAILGEKLRPDADGKYDLGQLGWCFVELTQEHCGYFD